MNDQLLFNTEGFLYRLVPEGAEVIYAPMQDHRVVIPSHLENHPVVALAQDYHDDLYLPTEAAEIVLPETLLHLPGRFFCSGRQVRCTLDEHNPHFTQMDQLIYRQLADGTKELVFVPDGAEELVLPHDVSRIGENAFAYSTVQRIKLGCSVKEIAAGAFHNSELMEISLPAVEVISEGAFAETYLQTVLLPASLVSLADTAFAHCELLQEIQLDERNETLQSKNGMILDAAGERLLAWPCACSCGELELPPSIREIGRALEGSTGIDTLRISAKLDSLCEGSLHMHCRQIIFEQEPCQVHPQAIEPLRESMLIHLSKRSSLPSLLADSHIEYCYIDADEAFLQALEQYRLSYENGGYTLLGCRDWQERVLIPSKIGDVPVLRIGANAFSEKANGLYPTEIVIPEGVVELKQASFFWLAQTVRQIELPASIQFISDGIFEDSNGLYRDMFLHEEIAFLTVEGSTADTFLRAYRRQQDDARGEELIVLSREPETPEPEPAEAEPEEEAVEEEIERTEPEKTLAEESEPEVIEPVFNELVISEPAAIVPEAATPEEETEEAEPEAFEFTPEAAEVSSEEPEVEPELPMEAMPVEADPVPAGKNQWKISRKKGLVVRYLGQDAQLVYPLEADGVSITGIADCTNQKRPRHFREITSVVLPEGYTCIGDSAFEGFTALDKVVLPATLRTIGKHAFDGCTSLRTLELPEGVMHVGKAAFKGSGLRKLIVHNKKLKLKKSVLKKAPKAIIYAPVGAKIFRKSLSKRAKLLTELQN